MLRCCTDADSFLALLLWFMRLNQVGFNVCLTLTFPFLQNISQCFLLICCFNLQGTKAEKAVQLSSVKCYLGLKKKLKPPTRYKNHLCSRYACFSTA